MSKRAKSDKRPVAKIDFKPYGAAIKAERMKLKESRNKVGSHFIVFFKKRNAKDCVNCNSKICV